MEITKSAVKTHELKCIDPHFTALKWGRKTFEIRRNDRDYKIGDLIKLTLHRGKQGVGSKIPGVDPITFMITHILTAEEFPQGIKPGFCILSIEKT